MGPMSPAQGQGVGQNISQNIGSPMSNEVYNVITALQSKLEGLEAYRKYAQDGNPQLWQYLTQVDTQAVQYLMQELERMVQAGQHRFRQPGQMAGQQGQTIGGVSPTS